MTTPHLRTQGTLEGRTIVMSGGSRGIGLAIAATSGIPAVLRDWGVWAISAGLVQLLVGVSRRRMGGQWAMIASGGISTLAGASFFGQAGQADPALGALAGYAFLGGVFFLVSALRLGRTRPTV